MYVTMMAILTLYFRDVRYKCGHINLFFFRDVRFNDGHINFLL